MILYGFKSFGILFIFNVRGSISKILASFNLNTFINGFDWFGPKIRVYTLKKISKKTYL
jgi:hypothetical protein